MLLPVNPDHPEPRKIKRAVELIQRGAVIAYPTDTVYGLGCDLLNKQAIDSLYQIKGMQRDKSLAFLCPDLSDIAKYAIVENQAYRVLRHFLPGPYCFILPATREVPKMLQTRQKTVGIRIPSHPVTLALMRELGRPLINTTASPSGEDPMVDPWEISERFGGVELVLDGGAGGSVPTTIVDLSEGYVKIIREGAGPIDELIALEK